jgi:enolase
MLTSGMTKCLEDSETGLLMMREAVRNASLNSTETVTTALDSAKEFMLTKLKENLEKK